MNIATLKDIATLERPASRRTKRQTAEMADAGDVTAIAAMLDYAIVEGGKLRMPLFVCMLRLALMALEEESGPGGRRRLRAR